MDTLSRLLDRSHALIPTAHTALDVSLVHSLSQSAPFKSDPFSQVVVTEMMFFRLSVSMRNPLA